MSVALLDVNVLVALFDPVHKNHEEAHQWFGRYKRLGWATCPVTINGCVRVLSNEAYRTVKATPAEVIRRLRNLCSNADHHFWSGSVAMTDETLFRGSGISGHQQITDVYLLGLAARNHGRLATFDRSIATGAVLGASAANVVLLARV